MFIGLSYYPVLGGGAPEMEVAVQLRQLAQERPGAEQYCWRVRSITFIFYKIPFTVNVICQ